MGSITEKGQVNDVEEDEACLNAMLFSSSHVLPMVFRAAIELDLFTIMAKSGPNSYLSASDIASHLPTTNPDVPSRLDRMLRLFSSHSLLSSSSITLPNGTVQTVYSLTPACEFFLTGGEQPSLAPMSALSHHRFTMESWMHVKDAILEGGNMFKKVHGETIFEQMKKDKTFNKTFNEGLAGLSRVSMREILKVYEGLEGIKTLVDVGGGNGTVLNIITAKYPSIQAINFDLPHVIQSAPSYPGIQHVGGDMLTSIPTGQAIMIKDTCHNWSDEIVIKVLKNIYEALENNGKVIIMNAILPEKPETTKASQYVSRLDNTMLMQSSGIERTAKQFECLIMAAGFSNFRVSCVACGIWAVMESYKY